MSGAVSGVILWECSPTFWGGQTYLLGQGLAGASMTGRWLNEELLFLRATSTFNCFLYVFHLTRCLRTENYLPTVARGAYRSIYSTNLFGWSRTMHSIPAFVNVLSITFINLLYRPFINSYQ